MTQENSENGAIKETSDPGGLVGDIVLNNDGSISVKHDHKSSSRSSRRRSEKRSSVSSSSKEGRRSSSSKARSSRSPIRKSSTKTSSDSSKIEEKEKLQLAKGDDESEVVQSPGARTSHSSRSPTRTTHSSRSPIRKSSTITDSKINKEKEKLRLAKGDESEDLYPGAIAVGDVSSNRPSKRSRDAKIKEKEKSRSQSEGVVSTPGATSVSDSSITSRDPIRSKKTSDAKSKEKSRSPTRESSIPGAGAVSGSRDRRSKMTSDAKSKEKSRSPSRGLSTPGANAMSGISSTRPRRAKADPSLGDAPSSDAEPLIALEATAVSDGSKVGQQRTEDEERERDQSSPEQMVVDEADDKRNKKYLLFAAVICFVLCLAAGITLAVVLAADDDKSNQVQLVSSTSEEDCRAVASGLLPSSQIGTDSTAIGVKIDFVVVAGRFNLDLFRSQLLLKMQQDLFPALVGCPANIVFEGDIDIVGVILSSLYVGNPESCALSTESEDLCATVYFEMDVYAKDDVESNTQVLVDLVNSFFRNECLSELLDLSTAVEDVYFNYTVEIRPSKAPSPSPSTSSNSNSTLSNKCLAIANGDEIQGLNEDVSVQEYEILLDVTMVDEIELEPVTIELEEKIQKFLMHSLAGCPEEGQTLEITTEIAYALVDALHDIKEACLQVSESPCYRYVIQLDLYVVKLAKSYDFSNEIKAKFQEAPLVERLGLLPSFVKATFVEILAQMPTAIPTSSPSQSPTFAPVLYPTTSKPTRTPSVRPSQVPTAAPSQSPTTLPVAYPTTEAPTRSQSVSPSDTQTGRPSLLSSGLPTSVPSSDPTLAPVTYPTTEAPTRSQSDSPSDSPSFRPSLVVSTGPSAQNSSDPSADPSLAPSKIPTTLPSVLPSRVPSQKPSQVPSHIPPAPIPSVSPSTTPVMPLYPCIQSNSALVNAANDYTNPLVIAQYGPIGDWCFGPAVNSMAKLFKDKATFNEDISRWDVSSVTDMRFMFNGAYAFNQNLGAWDVSAVTNMYAMFNNARAFNQDISNWDVSKVTTMYTMFHSCYAFNQDLGNWDVSLVGNTRDMFWGCTSFNQNLCAWGQRLGNAQDVRWMFRNSACPSASRNNGTPFLNTSPPGPLCHFC